LWISYLPLQRLSLLYGRLSAYGKQRLYKNFFVKRNTKLAFTKKKYTGADAKRGTVDRGGKKLANVSKEELDSFRKLEGNKGLSYTQALRKLLNADRTAARNTPLKQNSRQPSLSQAMDKPVGMKDDARRDNRGDFAGEGAAKSMAAESGAGAAAAREARAAEEKDASKYTTGMKAGGKVKGYAPGGSIGKGYGKARGARACLMR
jgi:hypothetical protein